VILSGCKKAECQTSSDCSSKTCSVSKCEEKTCVYTPQANCCGNGVKDAIESGLQGNECTCPQDYGKCEGIPKIKVGVREEDAVYAKYLCNNFNQCVLGVESQEIAAQNFLDSIIVGFFKASSVVRYNKPFDMSKDSFEFKITLDDANKDLVLPLRITSIRVLFNGQNSRSELLVAEKSLNSIINNIGESVTIFVPLNLNYKPEEVEESGSMRYTIDYNYLKEVPSGVNPDGSTSTKLETVREKYTSPAKQVFFVKTG